MDGRYHVMEEKSLISYSRNVGPCAENRLVEIWRRNGRLIFDCDWLPVKLKERIAESCGDTVCERHGLSIVDWLRQIRFNCLDDFTEVVGIDRELENLVTEEIAELRLTVEEGLDDAFCECRGDPIGSFSDDDRRNLDSEAFAALPSVESNSFGEAVDEEAQRDNDTDFSLSRHPETDISSPENAGSREDVPDPVTPIVKRRSNFVKSLSAIFEMSDEILSAEVSTGVTSCAEDSKGSRIGRSDINLIFDNASTDKPVPPVRRKNKGKYSKSRENLQQERICEETVQFRLGGDEVQNDHSAARCDRSSNDPRIFQSFLDIPRAIEAENLLNESSNFIRKRTAPTSPRLQNDWGPCDNIVSFDDPANRSNPEDLLLISRVSQSTKLRRHARIVPANLTIFDNDRERIGANCDTESAYKTLPIANSKRSYKRKSASYLGGRSYASEISLCSKINTRKTMDGNNARFCGTDNLNTRIKARCGPDKIGSTDLDKSTSPKSDIEFVRLEPRRSIGFSYESVVNEELEKLPEEMIPLIDDDALAKSNPMDNGISESEMIFGRDDLGANRKEITELTGSFLRNEYLGTVQSERVDEDELSKCRGKTVKDNANLNDSALADHRSHLIVMDFEECNGNEVFSVESKRVRRVTSLERDNFISDYVEDNNIEFPEDRSCFSGEINRETNLICNFINEHDYGRATHHVEQVEFCDKEPASVEANLLTLTDPKYCEEFSKLNSFEIPVDLRLMNILDHLHVGDDPSISKHFGNSNYDFSAFIDRSFEPIEDIDVRNKLNNLEKVVLHVKSDEINELEAKQHFTSTDMFNVKFDSSRISSDYFDENKDEKFESFDSEKSFHSALDKLSPTRSDCEDGCESLQVPEELAEKDPKESNENKLVLGTINKRVPSTLNISNISDNPAQVSQKRLYVNFPLQGNLENPDVMASTPNKPLRKRLNVSVVPSERKIESKINNNEVLLSLNYSSCGDSNLLEHKSDNLLGSSTIKNFVSEDVNDDAIRMKMKFRERKGSASSDIVHWKKCLRDTSLDDEDDWFSSNDAEGKIYFFEENSNESSWVLPSITTSEPSTTGGNGSYQNIEVRSTSSNEKIRVGKAHSMVLINQTAINQEFATRKSSSIPRDWPQLFNGNMCILMEGTMNRTKITENGKKLKKNWSTSHVVLTELFLLFFKDIKTFSAMKSGQSPTAKPDISVDLNGALIEPGERASSRKNVYIISTVLGLQVLIQNDNVTLANEWYQAIQTAVRCLPSSFETYEKSSSSMERQHEMNSKTFLDTNSPEETKKCSKIGRSRSVKIKRPDGSLEDLSGTVAERQTKIKAKLRRFFQRRPTVDLLVKNGIYKDEPAFGSYLNDVCPIEPPRVPRFVRTCIEILESNPENMKADGLYRASGNLSQIQKIRLQVDQNNLEILKREEDVHVLTGALKLFFRELKEPLIPFAFFEKALNASMLKKKLEKVQCFREIVKALPTANHDTLQFLLQHLLRVTTYQEYNRMHIPNLAIVFGPTLMWPAEESVNMALDLMQQNLVIECFLSEYDRIFK